jgi:trehalose 6-phosphate synthase
VHDRVRVPPGEESYERAPRLAEPRRGEGLLLRVQQRGAVAAVPRRAHAADLSSGVTGRSTRSVNRRFAEAVCEEVDSDDPIVLVQDYHFALAPRMIRERLPKATIITFWHIPWPNAERVGICPWREEIISGLLGSSIVGFHTQQHCNNFIDSVDAFMESRIDRERHAVVQGQPHARSALPDLHRVARALARPSATRGGVPRPGPARARPAPRTRCSGSASIGSTTPRASKSACGRGPAARPQPGASWAVHVCPARGPEPDEDWAVSGAQRPGRALAEEINAAWSSGEYRPIVCCAHHEPPTVFRYYACGRALLRQQPARRHEPGRQGVRRRSHDDERWACWCSASSPAPRET